MNEIVEKHPISKYKLWWEKKSKIRSLYVNPHKGLMDAPSKFGGSVQLFLCNAADKQTNGHGWNHNVLGKGNNGPNN